MTHTANGACRACGPDVRIVARARGAGDFLANLGCSIVSVGLWLPIWAISSLVRDWRCSGCGRRARRNLVG